MDHRWPVAGRTGGAREARVGSARQPRVGQASCPPVSVERGAAAVSLCGEANAWVSTPAFSPGVSYHPRKPAWLQHCPDRRIAIGSPTTRICHTIYSLPRLIRRRVVLVLPRCWSARMGRSEIYFAAANPNAYGGIYLAGRSMPPPRALTWAMIKMISCSPSTQPCDSAPFHPFLAPLCCRYNQPWVACTPPVTVSPVRLSRTFGPPLG